MTFFKLLVFMALQAVDQGAACHAFPADYPIKSKRMSMKHVELFAILDALFAQNQLLRGDRRSGRDNTLVNADRTLQPGFSSIS